MSKSIRLKDALKSEQKCAMHGTSHHEWMSETEKANNIFKLAHIDCLDSGRVTNAKFSNKSKKIIQHKYFVTF